MNTLSSQILGWDEPTPAQVCRAARLASQKRYNASPKGRARNARYEAGPKGIARKQGYERSEKAGHTRLNYRLSGAGIRRIVATTFEDCSGWWEREAPEASSPPSSDTLALRRDTPAQDRASHEPERDH